jgi:phenylpropionate dioxygenase-like ring-hydroxylating dioxygenase large terminal subunit
MIELDANYMLVADNLLDLSHGEFLHPMLAGPGSGKRLEYNFVQDGERVVAKHWLPGEPTSPLFKLGLGGDAPDVCNMWSDVTWNAPAVLEVEVGVTRVGGEKTDGAVTIAAHLITPQTPTRSHYFWRLARDFAIDDQALSGTLTEVITQAFSNEDKPMIEAQQEYIGNLEFDQMSPVLLQGDGAGLRARRIMSSLVKESAL